MDSYTAELRDIIDRAFTVEHSGRATAQMIHNSVFRELPEHLTDFLIGQGIRKQITAYFGAKDKAGLPMRPEANPEGEHVQLEILSVAEFAYVHRGYVDRAQANTEQAEKVRIACIEAHGVDPAAIGVTA